MSLWPLNNQHWILQTPEYIALLISSIKQLT